MQALGAQVPGVSQAAKLTGVDNRIEGKRRTQSARQSLIGMLNPLTPIPNTNKNALPAVTSGGGSATALPGGLSQKEIDALVREATRSARAQPQISQKEIDALIKAATGG